MIKDMDKACGKGGGAAKGGGDKTPKLPRAEARGRKEAEARAPVLTR